MNWKHFVTLATEVAMGCLIFLIHRGYKCIEKYRENLTSTTAGEVYSRNQPFPTFCPKLTPEFNEEILKDCNLTQDMYFHDNV